MILTLYYQITGPKHVNYTNMIAQVNLKEEVYIKLPRSLSQKYRKDMMLKSNTSLYGLCQAPKKIFEKLRDDLIEREFIQFEIDKCIFMKDVRFS